jgi:hypothetical protein
MSLSPEKMAEFLEDCMSLSPEKMAEFFVSELINDLDRLADTLLQLEDRWSKYGQQYQRLLSPEKQAELEACWQRFHERTKHLAD